MKLLDDFQHSVGSHCESGSVRNLLRHGGLEVTEPMVFGIGSGVLFAYVFFVKGPATMPLLGLRNPPGGIIKQFGKLTGVQFKREKYKTTKEAMARADELLDRKIPVAASVDMFYMKYLPGFMRVHAPSHFIVLMGRDEKSYAISDPYYDGVGVLDKQDLEAGWETRAHLANDNFLCYVDSVPEAIDWKWAARKSIIRSCRRMVLPPVIKHLVPFVGVEGIRFYARRVARWPDKYQGSVLREGVMFNAVVFEDQGTGGGGFRLMYGAFLLEVAELFGSEPLQDLARRMIKHGQDWRHLSRKIVTIGKRVPMDNSDYADWYAENGQQLREDLLEVSARFMEKADFEEKFFKDLLKTISKVG